MSPSGRRRRVKSGKQEKKKKAENPAVIAAVAWFTEEEWTKLTEIVPDRSKLDDTFQAWEKGAEAAVKVLQDKGVTVIPVMVDVEALAAWCKERGRQVDGAARAEYARYLLRTRQSLS
jgi:hypothetical protein